MPALSMAVTRNHGLFFSSNQPLSRLDRSKLAEVMARPLVMQVREVPQTTVMLSTGDVSISINLPFMRMSLIRGPCEE